MIPGGLPLLLLLGGCLHPQSIDHDRLFAHLQEDPDGAPAGEIVHIGDAALRVDVRAPKETASEPPIVMVHGFGSSLETWSANVNALSRDREVYRLDLRGFGRSSKYAGDYSSDTMVADLLGVFDHYHIAEADLAAHSYGCSVALAFALAHPERVRKLVLSDGFVYSEQMPWFFAWSRTPVLGEALFGLFYTQQLDWRMGLSFYDPSIATWDMVQKSSEVLELPGTRNAALSVVRGLNLRATEHHYGRVRQETLILWGREDQVTDPLYGERLSRHLPHARLEVIPFSGHFPMLEAASAWNDRVLAFLGGRS